MSGVILTTEVILLLFLPHSTQIVKYVDTCPTNDYTWAQRSRQFQCDSPHEVYHCIRNINKNVIETCMIAQTISSFKVGCPWVHIYNDKPHIGNPFHACDRNRCPEKGHRKYRTDKLYIYPACIKTGNTSRVNVTRDLSETDNVTERYDSTTVQERPLYGSIAAFLVCGTVFIMMIPVVCKIVKRKYEQRLQESNQTIRIENTIIEDLTNEYNEKIGECRYVHNQQSQPLQERRSEETTKLICQKSSSLPNRYVKMEDDIIEEKEHGKPMYQTTL